MPLAADTLSRYPNEWFVETGTFRGGGLLSAFRHGFKFLRSVETSRRRIAQAKRNLVNNGFDLENVRIWHGLSEIRLEEMIAEIATPVTFWLDAHGKGKACPLLQELAIIGRHSLKNHTILIDDVRLMGHKHLSMISQEQVKSAVLSINPSYHFKYEDGFSPMYVPHVLSSDILVAEVQS